jgi:tRNA nucleotidyltransferase/poly(A) polymerase
VTAARVFAAADAPLYAVGGIVRNDCMGLPASDVDLCGPTRPEHVAAFCEGSAVRTVLRAAHFGTVELHVADPDGRHMGEYTTFRVDSYRGGHQPFAVRFADTLEVDALRRDFSVNALYRLLLPEGPGPVNDPTGGLAHLQQGILHTVTDDPDLVLQDDGLRILRAARFQAELGLTPTGALLASAQKFAPLLSQIARERLRDELAKLLTADARYPMLRRDAAPVPSGLDTLRTVGAWALLFPDFPADEAAVAALGTYKPPEGMPALAGKLALLFHTAEPEALSGWMQTYRFAQRDALAAAAALTATRALAEGRLPLVEAMRLGMPVIAHARAAFTAL